MERPPLFEFLDALAMATARRELSPPQAAAAILIAIAAKGTTGEDATIDAARIADKLGVTERSVWRYVHDLVEAGWLEQTVDPLRGRKGRPGTGRKARYGVRCPGSTASGHTAGNGLTATGRSVSDDAAYGLTDPDLWPDTAKRGDVTVLRTDGSPTSTHPSSATTGSDRSRLMDGTA